MTWPQKADALGTLARQGAANAGVRAWADRLGLAGMGARGASARIASELETAIGYQRERGDRFASAAEVMAAGVDDCDGHAVLGAALAKAAGLPARIVGVSTPGDRWPRHVRAEVGDGETWHSADSTPARHVSPTVIHRPIAYISTPPVAGIVGDGLGLLAEVLVLPFRPLAAAGQYIDRKVRELYDDPIFWLSLAAIVGCSVAGGPVVAAACTKALPVAKKALAARAIDVDAWQNAETPADLQREIDRTRRRDPQAFAAAEVEVERVMQMDAGSLTEAEAREVVMAMGAHRDPLVRDRSHVVVGMVRSWGLPARPIVARWTGLGGDSIIQPHAQQAVRDVIARRPAGHRLIIVGDGAAAQREPGNVRDRGQTAALAALRNGSAPPLRPDVRKWLTEHWPDTWAAVWVAANTQRRAELTARAMIDQRQLGALRPDLQNWLESRWPDTWATRWRAASASQRQAWLLAMRGQIQAVERNTPDLSAALRVRPQTPAPAKSSAAPIVIGVGLLALGARFMMRK